MDDTTSIDVVVLHSDEDDQYRLRFREHIGNLISSKVIRLWDSSCIAPGAVYDDEFRDHITKADIIIILVSSALLNDWAYNEYNGLILGQVHSGASKIIPIRIRPCDLVGTELENIKTLPEGIASIDESPDQNAAWASVAKALREVLKAAKTAGRRYTPQYADEKVRALSRDLEHAITRKKELERIRRFNEAADVKKEIIAIQRQLREGQLQSGDYLGDDRFSLLRKIGEGGYAVVWQALDLQSQREVAIKQLHPRRANDPIALSRFRRGAERMAALSHPAIVPVLEPCREEGKFHYFVMPFFSGGNLHEAVTARSLSTTEILRILVRIAEALGVAHLRGWVHRDVKPPNILLDADGNPHLTDFDLIYAPDTTGGTDAIPISTYLFSAPEAMSSPQDATPRADVYSLGMTAVVCLYGDKFPFSEWEERRSRDGIIKPLPCNTAVKKVLRKAISAKPTDRFANASKFAEEMAKAIAHVEADDVEVSIAQRPNIRRSDAPASMLEMCEISSGQFWMGTTQQDEASRPEERPMHAVTISTFLLSRNVINRKIYTKVVSDKRVQKNAELPVEVAWLEAILFCNRLSELDGLDPAYVVYELVGGVEWNLESDGYRLPTEAEWEYAARGRDGRTYPWGNEAPTNQLCWNGDGNEFGGGGRQGPSPVGAYSDGASPFGLLDMVGNAIQWCWDWYGPYEGRGEQLASDPIGPEHGVKRVARGANWRTFKPSWVRAAMRTQLSATDKAGIRCARGPLGRSGRVETRAW